MATSSRIMHHVTNKLSWAWHRVGLCGGTVLQRPPQSPDLNPLDHLWDVVVTSTWHKMSEECFQHRKLKQFWRGSNQILVRCTEKWALSVSMFIFPLHPVVFNRITRISANVQHTLILQDLLNPLWDLSDFLVWGQGSDVAKHRFKCQVEQCSRLLKQRCFNLTGFSDHVSFLYDRSSFYAAWWLADGISHLHHSGKE